MSDERTVYINTNPAGETEVYHADRHHASTLNRWRDRFTREATVPEARDGGFRPCKQCFPDESGECCPACGYPGDGDDVLANGQQWCQNESCAVVSFNGGEE